MRDFFYGNNTAYIVMEYIDGIDMRKYLKRLGRPLRPAEVFSVLRDVLRALSAVHKAGIIHRDISPDNLMLTREGKVKLIDFGASKDYSSSAKGAIFLKKGYAPIEQYSRDGRQGPWTDVYSLCASMYYLMTGVRIPVPQERMKQDSVRLLREMGVPILPRQDLAIQKGLRIEAKERHQTVGDLYQDLYGTPI